MYNPFKNISDSFKNTVGGYSGRKLSALVGVLTGVYITVRLLPITDQLHALYVWLLFALLLMGVVTIQNIIELKNGNKTITETTTTTSEQKNEA